MSGDSWLLAWGRRLFSTTKDKQVEGRTTVQQIGGDGQQPVTAVLVAQDEEFLVDVQRGRSRQQ